MTQTLRRELRTKFRAVCVEFLTDVAMPEETAEKFLDALADAALELRVFKTPTARIDRKDEEWSELADKKISALLPADQAEVEAVKLREEISNLYESEMGYNPLQWWTDKKLIRLQKFLIKQTPEDIKTFAAWSKKPFSPLSPTQARKNPDLVAECWPQAFQSNLPKQNEPKAFNGIRDFLQEQTYAVTD